MASTEENLNFYELQYEWQDGGEEWSWAWGGSDMQWYGTWLPRIHTYLPARSILEIGAGFGRWSAYLEKYCSSLILVDISKKCINACRERFSHRSHIEYLVNDGSSLACVADNSIDFVCSFDSLVHVNDAVLRAYIQQLADKLSGDGVAFIHHSNLGACQNNPNLTKEPTLHERDASVKAQSVRQQINDSGLVCCSQELINWGTQHLLIDSLTVFTRPTSRWTQDFTCIANEHFMDEVEYWGKLAALYGKRRRAASTGG